MYEEVYRIVPEVDEKVAKFRACAELALEFAD
jgi:hypothetical protein